MFDVIEDQASPVAAGVLTGETDRGPVHDPAPTGEAPRARTWPAETRALIKLAGPLVLTQLAQMAIMTTDVILLGRLSTDALASAAIGNTVYFFCWLVGSGPAMAVSPMAAQLLGAKPGDRAGVRGVVRMGLWSAGLIAVPLLPLLICAEWILSHLGQEPRLAAGAGQFTTMLCFGLPFALAFGSLRNFVTALNRPAAALWVTLASIVWNALAGWVLIFGHLGAPRLGIAGAGIASSTSAIFGVAALALAIRLTPELHRGRILKRWWRPRWAALAELFRLGIPIGVTMLFEAMLFNSMTLLVGTFGAAALAGHQIALNVASFTFMIPLGLGMAASVRVGRFVGAGDLPGARRAGLVAMVVAFGFILPCGVILALFGREVAGLYVAGRAAHDLQVIAFAGVFLQVAAAFQVFDALQVVAAQSLRGLKDARMPMILAGVSYWLAGAPMCLYLGLGLHMQGLGVWIGLAFGLGVAAATLCVRFHRLTRPGISAARVADRERLRVTPI